MPNKLWGEAVRNSVYILNRVPTRALTGKTPYEVWYERKPDLSHVRVFGCVAYMKVTGSYVSKLEDRSKRVVNLGKEPGTKGYRLYDPVNRRVCVSRDVSFEEAQTWPWSEHGEKEAEGTWFNISSESEADEEEQVEEDAPGGEEFQEGSPVQSSTAVGLNPENYDDSAEPRRSRLVSEIYGQTEPVDLSEELNLMGVDEPTNFRQAAGNQNWMQAMRQEMNSIEENETWELVPLPPGQKIIGLKWIFKLK